MIVQLNTGGMRNTRIVGTLERYRHSFHLLHMQYIEVGFADPHGSASIGIAGFGTESRRAKFTHKKRKKLRTSCFEVLDFIF
jgi:hypothetical protein